MKTIQQPCSEKQQDKIDTLERYMRQDAWGIAERAEQINAIDPAAAIRAMNGIIEYLQERREALGF